MQWDMVEPPEVSIHYREHTGEPVIVQELNRADCYVLAMHRHDLAQLWFNKSPIRPRVARLAFDDKERASVLTACHSNFIGHIVCGKESSHWGSGPRSSTVRSQRSWMI